MKLFIFLFFLFIQNQEILSDDRKDRIYELRIKSESGDKKLLKNAKGKRLVIVFLSPGCPICIHYTHVLNNVSKIYPENEVVLLGVVPGKFSSNEIRSFKDNYKINFPLLRDKNNVLVRELNASVTPEVFLIDESARVRYRGMIDNIFSEIGKKKVSVDHYYLVDAINSLINKKDVAVQETNPIGCLINRFYE